MNPRKKQILDVAHRLFIEKGFQNTSIQDILDGARIAKGTFYNHFASKNACLMAILDQVRDEASYLREQLSLGKPKNDPEIFIQQVLVRMKMNREQSLLALYESVFSSKDEELKTHMKKQHMNELKWTASRIVELFGIDTKRHSMDFAVIFFGIIQQTNHVRMLGSKREYDLEDTVRFAFNRLQLLSGYQNKIVPFFPVNWLDIDDNNNLYSKDYLKERMINQLDIIVSHLKNENVIGTKLNYLEFLLSEFQSDKPREFLIESVLCSVENVFSESIYKEDVNDICDLARQYLTV
ncbi:TetR/AcrR family transcriptional regulator [Lederbergia wuyishanensis]|uniref:AcrR family transcriptional regulator n=1 Tax=Lederbergia wuyishanensis TaxID=1347903 RepID=A0ABU0CYJ2_9BACI|nr:TetR/AcrR family transcriptional regulator [Lederbergia wuyishanensis]MCJ8005851.1 TetR/AcrR family transcriptional regulator [Lederbergia wuyishanensis]MDQ0341216.1 AcrR family transcriptional regulator [Lederbergia wuyishanensis]